MAKKSGGGKKTLSQKLGSGSAQGVAGMGLAAKLEGAASVPYKGVSLGSGVTHGAHLLAGKGGGGKKLKPPVG